MKEILSAIKGRWIRHLEHDDDIDSRKIKIYETGCAVVFWSILLGLITLALIQPVTFTGDLSMGAGIDNFKGVVDQWNISQFSEPVSILNYTLGNANSNIALRGSFTVPVYVLLFYDTEPESASQWIIPEKPLTSEKQFNNLIVGATLLVVLYVIFKYRIQKKRGG